jgi:PAS domain S-box-containing protein
LRTSKILSVVALVFPALTTVGWIFGIPWLTQGHPSLPVMHANTATGLALGAIAVLLTPENPPTHRRASIVLLLSSAILLLGLLTLAEYAFEWDVGIDRIFGHGVLVDSDPFPGRPSPQTSLNFVLLGAVLFVFNLGWPIRLGQIGAIVAGANSIAALTGHIFGARTFYGFPLHSQANGMAVHTAISFVLLVAALLCRRPNEGMMTLVASETNSGSMARRILLAAIVAPPLVGVMTRLGIEAGWYSVSTENSLFVLVLAALIVRTTWRAARRAEHEELQAQAAIDALQGANAELNRASSERRMFAALVENSSDFIGIADDTGCPVYLNPGGRRMVGLAPDFPVRSTRIADYYPADQRAFARDVIVKSMVERGHWEGETAFRHWQTEEAIPVSDTHFMIREPETGRAIGMGTVTRDISEIKRAREEIEQTNRRLAQADRLKTRFFTNVSHELRTPLTLILGPLERHLRATSDLDPDLRRDLEVVERNARTILRHVNDLLDIARIHAGRLAPEYSETDAAAIVRVVAEHFSTLATEKHIQFAVETPPALHVQTDLDKLQRILLNLLSNAFKFTPGGERVRLSLREAGGRFSLEVADSGPGIPLDKREAVFERFEQLEVDAARPPAGTGLGLSIVRDFAALLGGQVSIGDAPEGGALFVLDLPSAAPPGTAIRPGSGERLNVREVDQLVDEFRAPRAVPGGDVASERSHGRVLVVEDNRDIGRFIADSLRSEGFEVSTAFDGREGYDKAVAERPDLVLTDVMMPSMNGAELVRQLRQRPELSSMSIVVLTAITDDELRVRLLSEGAQDYLNKPFSVAELQARVRNLVARTRAEDYLSRLRRQIAAVSLASTEISEAVASVPEESVRTVLHTIALNAQNLTGAEFAAAGIGADPARPFEVWTFLGASTEQAAKLRPPSPADILGLVSKGDESVRLRDLREHPAYRGLPPHHPEMRSFLGAPIRYRGRVAGNLYLANKRNGAEFTAEDQQIVEMLAARAGVAIETARLYAAEGRAHTWLQAVLDQMPEGIVLMDAEGRVTIRNQALRVLTNARPPVPDRFGNLMTIDLRRTTGEPVEPDDMPIIKAMVEREITWGQEFVGRRVDDRLTPFLVSAAPILGADRNLDGAVMVFQDISALKELERMREEWASIIAHDLRQPISVIALRSALLQRARLSHEHKNDVRQIHAAAERLNRMTSDLMDASLLETRRMQVALERLDLCQFLRDVVQRAPPGTRPTKTRTPAGLRLFIKGDAERLEQVLANLLSNAVKYGAPETDIGLEIKHAYGNAEILVTNRGAGIPSDELPLLFDRYVRSRAAETGTARGLGLGLYIARGLVEAHHGHIWAESVPGDVTTFHVVIPLDGPPVPADAPASDEAAASHPELHGVRS